LADEVDHGEVSFVFELFLALFPIGEVGEGEFGLAATVAGAVADVVPVGAAVEQFVQVEGGLVHDHGQEFGCDLMGLCGVVDQVVQDAVEDTFTFGRVEVGKIGLFVLQEVLVYFTGDGSWVFHDLQVEYIGDGSD
jgi:hypothetical protein